MKSFVTGLTAIALLTLASVQANAQAASCSYYWGDVYSYYPYSGQSFQAGQNATGYCYIYVWVEGWPEDATWQAWLSTNNRSTWSYMQDISIYYYDYYYYYGYSYGYFYGTIRIPSTASPSSQCYVRYLEAPAGKGNCAWTYTYTDAGPFTITRPCVPPTISQQPVSRVVCLGASTNFTAVASSDPGWITYEWYKNNTLFATTSTPTLNFASVTANDAGSYFLRVKDACGTQTNSNTVTLTVNMPTAIVTHPVGKTVCQGDAYSMSVSATGTNLTYQWRKNGINIPGATTSTFGFTSAVPNDAGVYTVVVSGACGAPIVSNNAVIDVPPKPEFLAPLKGGTYCPGVPVVLQAQVSGSPLVYQWYKGDVPIPGANSATYTISAMAPSYDGFYWLHVRVPGAEATGCPAEASSGRVFVSTYGVPHIVESPESQDVCNGGTVTLNATVSGADVNYQWFKDGTPIPNSNNYALELKNVTPASAGKYYVQATGMCNASASSEEATVAVYSAPEITQQPADQSIMAGQTLTLSIEAIGAQEVTWLHNEQVVSTGTSTTLTIPNATPAHSGFYRALVKNVCSGEASTLAKVLVVDPSSLVPTIAITQPSINAGNVPFGYSKETVHNALVANVGNVPITITGFSFTGPDAGDFVVTSPVSNTLAKGESMNVTIRFTPSRVGTSQATFNVASDATAGTNSASISGQGVVLYNTDQNLEFGITDKKESRIKCFNVNNTSSSSITIDAINVTGVNQSEFRVTTSLPLVIDAGSTKEICVEFTPQEIGNRTAVLALMSSTGGNSNVDASGTCEIASGVTQDALSAGMNVFPNPASSLVTINTGDVVASQVVIVNSQGSVVATMHPTEREFTWNCADAQGRPVASGVYNIIVTNEAGSYHMKLQVSR